ncbi:MAG: hypothetical protein A2020_14300 [Lentisphaerae bacterium GWF2_45_14]|nr:MAG: hypothetical protein A2020_14300 [Lentisphaerae bacterium GWF2_45_14]
MSGLEKGAVFKVDITKTPPEFILKMARNSEKNNIDGRTFPVSHTILQKALYQNALRPCRKKA